MLPIELGERIGAVGEWHLKKSAYSGEIHPEVRALFGDTNHHLHISTNFVPDLDDYRPGSIKNEFNPLLVLKKLIH